MTHRAFAGGTSGPPPKEQGRSPLHPTALTGYLLAALALAGCHSNSPGPYLAPRVTGRVLDARTSQPLADVKVRRITSDQDLYPETPAHGGQAIAQAPIVRTSREGKFTLPSVRDLALFRRSGWYAVSIALEHPRYLRRVMDYTLANATNSASGEPIVRAGDIRLEPLSK